MRLERGLWKVKAQYDMVNDGHSIVICREGSQGERELYRFAEPQPIAPGSFIQEDQTIQVDDGFLRAFLDCAWELGLRPTGYSNVHEAMKATDKHLQDMRAIAFGKLKISPTG
jgi:hypothetical protein